MGVTLVVHGHFYQPPRENPWTEEVEREPSAAPFHDWNERIAEECYRPNAYARVVDDNGVVHDIVDNYRHLSFNIGPTLFSWLDEHQPAIAAAISADADGAIAQAYSHLILPLATERDVRTQVRWGLADYRHRFGREAPAMWLPECAVDEDVLAVLAEEGVRATILAPNQVEAVRPIDDEGAGGWIEVDGDVDTTAPLRWVHPRDPTLRVELIVYDGALSNDIAFGLDHLSSAEIVERAARVGDGLAVIATDGETFGHHHRWGERAIAYALTVEAPKREVRPATVVEVLDTIEPHQEGRVRRSAWSCAHGVGRWHRDCGCSTGGEAGWDQTWRGPLRAGLDVVHARLTEITERRGRGLFVDPWEARDAYIGVVLDPSTTDDFLGEHVIGDVVDALTLLEAHRHAMAMYTSCGWFFNDLAGIETIQILRYAARVLDLLAELGEDGSPDELLVHLVQARSNVEAEGTGADLWYRHVVPATVGTDRVAAHLALASALAGDPPPDRIAAWDVLPGTTHARSERGGLALTTALVELRHRRTRRGSVHAVAALGLGGLEVVGAGHPAPERDEAQEALAAVRSAFLDGAPVTAMLVLLGERLGSAGFGLEAALPGRGEELLADVASSLVDRFGASLDHLLADARPTLDALVAGDVPLPLELQRTAEVALVRRIEALVRSAAGSMRLDDYAEAVALARSPLASQLDLDSPVARRIFSTLLLAAAEQASGEPGDVTAQAVTFALGLLGLAEDLGIHFDVDRAQERVFTMLRDADRPDLEMLAAALHLAVDPS